MARKTKLTKKEFVTRSLHRKYPPSGPGGLNAIDTVAWKEYCSAHSPKTRNKETIKELYKNFLESENFSLNKKKPPSKEESNPGRSFIWNRHSVKQKDKTTPSGTSESLFIKQCISSCSYASLGSYIHKNAGHLSNQQIKEIVELCFSIRETGKKKEILEIDTLLKVIKEVCHYRGKKDFSEIGHDDWFQWPKTDIFTSLSKDVIKNDKWHDYNLFTHAGYRVGYRNAQSLRRRQTLLSFIFESTIPENLENHLSSWGKRASPIRLRKMAHVISYNVKIKKRIKYKDYSRAIFEWEEDLHFLYSKYYCDFFKFHTIRAKTSEMFSWEEII